LCAPLYIQNHDMHFTKKSIAAGTSITRARRLAASGAPAQRCELGLDSPIIFLVTAGH
jgi:hypothetical protein